MRRTIRSSLLVSILILFLAMPKVGSSISRVDNNNVTEGSFVPNEILLGIKPQYSILISGQKGSIQTSGLATLDLLNQKYGVKLMQPLFQNQRGGEVGIVEHGFNTAYKIVVAPGTDLFTAIQEYGDDPVVAYAEPNQIFTISEVPNDTDFSIQWALHNTGQSGGVEDADIDAPEAWDIEKGKPTVLIAVVDTGVNYNHPDLTGERIRTDIDKDFINQDDDALDDQGHGTYVTGIIAANSNNQQGIAGVCQGCSIVPIKVLDSEGQGTSETVAQGIQYAGQINADIINMSLGMASNCGCSKTIANTINYAYESGSLLIAASGNNFVKDGLSYPASSPRVMSVGASNRSDHEADFSNRNGFLNIIAPGEDIYGLSLDNGYRSASGTSAAAPHVSGAAGLILSKSPELTNEQVWWILYQSADRFPGGSTAAELNNPRSSTAFSATELPFAVFVPVVTKAQSPVGRLNAYRALVISSGGKIVASQDSCEGESECPPGCVVEVTVAGAEDAFETLRILRSYRDSVLASSALGRQWIQIYERHRLETARILLLDPQFRGQTRNSLATFLPLVRALVNPKDYQDIRVTPAQVEAVNSMLQGFIERGSPELKSDLTTVGGFLRFERLVGMQAEEAWDLLKAEYSH